ncbi:hypothetical protein [Halorubrum sp. BOL3-1]|uniref:hypothetical protein n=1 Tax=Halorubrum sp. BOL3-1 TaxID=2497325 RepID=UPI00140B257C|nr:hypothetical protein [Halorubrum sp. BOL3-1]
MNAAGKSELYHLVCRECRLERLCDTAGDADAVGRDHADETRHRVVVERID